MPISRRRDQARVEAHLAECTRCSIVASEAKEVSSRLALVLLPLALGVDRDCVVPRDAPGRRLVARCARGGAPAASSHASIGVHGARAGGSPAWALRAAGRLATRGGGGRRRRGRGAGTAAAAGTAVAAGPLRGRVRRRGAGHRCIGAARCRRRHGCRRHGSAASASSPPAAQRGAASSAALAASPLSFPRRSHRPATLPPAQAQAKLAAITVIDAAGRMPRLVPPSTAPARARSLAGPDLRRAARRRHAHLREPAETAPHAAARREPDDRRRSTGRGHRDTTAGHRRHSGRARDMATPTARHPASANGKPRINGVTETATRERQPVTATAASPTPQQPSPDAAAPPPTPQHQRHRHRAPRTGTGNGIRHRDTAAPTAPERPRPTRADGHRRRPDHAGTRDGEVADLAIAGPRERTTTLQRAAAAGASGRRRGRRRAAGTRRSAMRHHCIPQRGDDAGPRRPDADAARDDWPPGRHWGEGRSRTGRGAPP